MLEHYSHIGQEASAKQWPLWTMSGYVTIGEIEGRSRRGKELEPKPQKIERMVGTGRFELPIGRALHGSPRKAFLRRSPLMRRAQFGVHRGRKELVGTGRFELPTPRKAFFDSPLVRLSAILGCIVGRPNTLRSLKSCRRKKRIGRDGQI
jgi:hypothetical protein